jgi:hypothetical protein
MIFLMNSNINTHMINDSAGKLFIVAKVGKVCFVTDTEEKILFKILDKF